MTQSKQAKRLMWAAIEDAQKNAADKVQVRAWPDGRVRWCINRRWINPWKRTAPERVAEALRHV